MPSKFVPLMRLFHPVQWVRPGRFRRTRGPCWFQVACGPMLGPMIAAIPRPNRRWHHPGPPSSSTHGDGRDRPPDRQFLHTCHPRHFPEGMAVVPGRRDVHGGSEQPSRMGDRPVASDARIDGRGLSPAELSVMVLMSEEYGADGRLVAFMQYLRVVRVAAVAAAVIARFWVDPSGAAVPQTVLFPPVHCSLFARRWRSPGSVRSPATSHANSWRPDTRTDGRGCSPRVTDVVTPRTPAKPSWRRPSAGGSAWSSPAPS